MLLGDLRSKIKDLPDDMEIYFTCCVDGNTGHSVGNVEEATVPGEDRKVLLIDFAILTSKDDIDFLFGGCDEPDE